MYDGNGNRYSKKTTVIARDGNPAAISERYYPYDTSGNIVSEYKRVMVNGVEESQALVRYVRDAGGKAISMIQGTNTYYFIYNGHGDVTALTDSTGTVVATYSYDEFGNQTSSTGTVYNPLRYSGAHNAYYDSETSLYKMGTRYYQPDIGRWLTRDKYEGEQLATQSLNRYVYALNNPTNLVDSSGYKAKKIILDPGHGGIKNKFGDPGALIPQNYIRAYKATGEATVNRRVSYWLYKYLKSKGYIVHKTRSLVREQAISYESRVSKAKEYDMFVSVHHNSGGGQGAEVLYQPNNKKGSQRLASTIASNLGSIGLVNRGAVPRSGSERLHVLEKTMNIPSVLVEPGFVDAPQSSRDFQLLTKVAGRKSIGQAIGKGIEQFFK